MHLSGVSLPPTDAGRNDSLGSNGEGLRLGYLVEEYRILNVNWQVSRIPLRTWAASGRRILLGDVVFDRRHLMTERLHTPLVCLGDNPSRWRAGPPSGDVRLL